MSQRSDICTIVKLRGGGGDYGKEIKGRFKGPADMTERQALRTVLHQFTHDELPQIESIVLDPVVPLIWLKAKRVYEIGGVE